ncbi:hypothetical protein LCGC14_2885370 [marine sediment metagenome]|uniref:Uncharacterized protein n=1 Tax=marine sediment metagenome TaxID=412755 RepID=A0A0F9APY9_9ZZZZ
MPRNKLKSDHPIGSPEWKKEWREYCRKYDREITVNGIALLFLILLVLTVLKIGGVI